MRDDVGLVLLHAADVKMERTMAWKLIRALL